jgi:hypothetical protein
MQSPTGGRAVICGHARQSPGLLFGIGHTACIDRAIKMGGW